MLSLPPSIGADVPTLYAPGPGFEDILVLKSNLLSVLPKNCKFSGTYFTTKAPGKHQKMKQTNNHGQSNQSTSQPVNHPTCHDGGRLPFTRYCPGPGLCSFFFRLDLPLLLPPCNLELFDAKLDVPFLSIASMPFGSV